ncbi:hypothetical protein [Kitasatospora sp. NPDC059160]|uniref:hypothetical protein n=1 Tax=Kitasatospora sp. NPDC059160 TaxID=3346748 RepID=UPI003699075C
MSYWPGPHPNGQSFGVTVPDFDPERPIDSEAEPEQTLRSARAAAITPASTPAVQIIMVAVVEAVTVFVDMRRYS